jgi:AcrR family transcriptional regulator
LDEIGEISQAKEQVLLKAAQLFNERGYTAVTLKDIAEALGVKQAALYYHFPKGKEQLFVEVIVRTYQQHGRGIQQVISQAENTFSARLKAIANWLLSQPPLDMARLARSDLPALAPENASKLVSLGEKYIQDPIRQVIIEAQARGEIRPIDTDIVATSIITMIETLHFVYSYKHLPKSSLIDMMLDILVEGLRQR